MYKSQYKARSPYDSWITIGSFGSEAQAISSALFRKNRGAIIVRVLDKKGKIVYTG